MSDLARSESYYKKKCLEKIGHIPPQSEIKKRLGPSLTQAFFQSCLPVIKPFLGLCPTLDGPGDDLWVSPSDLLIGKVRLKPPLTSKYIKALTHQGILDIGAEVEEKYNMEHESLQIKSLQEQEETLHYASEKYKQAAIDKTREEEKLKHDEIVEELKKDFHETLKDELKKLENKLEKEKYDAVEDSKKRVEKLMQEKLELATIETVHRLTEQFAGALIKHSKCLHEHFWYHIKKEKTKLKKIIAGEQSSCREKLEKLRVEMQCENIANIMYVLAKERRKCCCEKQLLEHNFAARLAELEKEIDNRSEELERSTQELEKLGLTVVAREEAMYEIIKQFQKFIYFVLRAVPTQAEYLLNVEKLMIVHLTKTVQEIKPEFFQLESVRGEESVISEGVLQSDGIVPKDYHDCDNLIKYIPSTHSMPLEEDLPAFTYGEKLYVREDFRNMISQGLKISRSNEFWNFGVADVINIIEPRRISDIEEEISNIVPCTTDKKAQICSDKKSYVSVRFSKGFEQVFFEEEVLHSHQYSVVASEAEETDKDSIHSNATLNTGDVDIIRPQSKLEMARDSLTVLTEKKTRTSFVNLSPHKEDSLILGARRSVDSKIIGTKEVVNQTHKSKIELAVDSFLLLKSNPNLAVTNQEPVCEVMEKSFVQKRNLVNIGIQVEPDPKSVRISHIEVIPDSNCDKMKMASVSFHSHPKIIPEKESETVVPEQLPLKWKSPDDIYGKKQSITVSGDRSSTAHQEKQDEFAAKRVNSFIRIFREHPSLRRLFTEVKNK